MVLITNKQSNILQDIDTLQSFSRAVSDHCKTLDEKEVANNAFELLAYFDEIVSMGGYQESVSSSQIKTIIGMESQEERIQAEIAKTKEKEAKEDMNRKMRALEIQKKEMSKKGSAPSSGGYGGYSDSYGSNTASNSHIQSQSYPITQKSAPYLFR